MSTGRGNFHLLTNTIIYRIYYRMKVTAIIADDLVNNVKAYTRSSTVTEAIMPFATVEKK